MLVIAAAVWWRWAAPRAVPPDAHLSVLLVTIDTLRADAVGAYGNLRGATPWIDKLAAAGARFERAYAHNVVTLPSHANILSGRYPIAHGVRDNAGFRFPASAHTLATELAARRYRTGAFVSAFPLDSRFGLSVGFDVYEDSFLDARGRPAFLEQERSGRETVALARAWLDADKARPSFCWVHVYEPHAPYRPPEPFASRFASEPYIGEVAATDAALQPLLEPILEAGPKGTTLVILTSDHGESLGEHGEATHGLFAYESTLRVPLVVYDPRRPRGRVVTSTAQHVDIAPTVLDVLGLPPAADLDGRSQLPAIDGRKVAPAPIYFEALSAWLDRGWAPLRGVVLGPMKFIDLPIPEAYDLVRDAREAHNLVDAQPAEVTQLRARLAPFLAADQGARPIEEKAETRERLKSLGYVSSGGSPRANRFTPDDDPKRLVELDDMLQDVVTRYTEGDLAGALARCREVVKRRPGMAVSQMYLAQLERDSGNLPAAIDAMREATRLRPDNVDSAMLLGAYLAEAGRGAEAIAVLGPIATGDAPGAEVLATYALALARERRFAEAAAAIDKARAADPSNGMVLVHAGTVALMAGDRVRARESFEAALTANPGLARAHTSLAFMDGEDGRLDAAIAHFRQAGAIDPAEYGKVLALASILAQRGQAGAARSFLEFFVASAPRSAFAPQIDQARAWLSQTR